MLRSSSVGLTVGIGGAALAGSVLQSLLFGVSLFVWAALLAVTLGSLAIGYYAGGVMIDRSPQVRLLGAVIVPAWRAATMDPVSALRL